MEEWQKRIKEINKSKEKTEENINNSEEKVENNQETLSNKEENTPNINEKNSENSYINLPFNQEEYEEFWKALTEAEVVTLHEFEKREIFEGCMPIEIMAKRGKDTLRFGPLKPVGFDDPRTGKRPYAVVQLRQDDTQASIYNIVGFQTNLKFGEQKRVFSMIPGLEKAEFIKYGVMHRNTYINSPTLLDQTYNLKSNTNIYFAGQNNRSRRICRINIIRNGSSTKRSKPIREKQNQKNRNRKNKRKNYIFRKHNNRKSSKIHINKKRKISTNERKLWNITRTRRQKNKRQKRKIPKTSRKKFTKFYVKLLQKQ